MAAGRKFRPSILVIVAVTLMTASHATAQTANPQRRQPSIQRRVSIPRNQATTAQQGQAELRLRHNWHAQQFRRRLAFTNASQDEPVPSPQSREVYDPKRLFAPPTLRFLQDKPDTGYVRRDQPQRASNLRPGQFDPNQAQRQIGQRRNANDSANRYGRGAESRSFGRQKRDGTTDYWNIRNQNHLFGLKTGNTAQDLYNARTGNTLYGVENPDGSVDYLDPFSGKWNFATPARDLNTSRK